MSIGTKPKDLATSKAVTTLDRLMRDLELEMKKIKERVKALEDA
tara:strand:- start:4411 stop:4542 length:132 start_codon:yes stop_codon:yes gene_type:complete